ncbi:Hypothetical predicted protein [Cloeon dipterum]|uniref:Uncharacterized protein n=1 Tax=Cloeon dipterum TaxID=197152 RepID=A0A8S1CU86_9INSE|nr:Hypothetical predicted protein [Cloeon dipterum]
MVDDETVLNLAKKRLQTIRAKSYSLEKLAVRTLLKNIRFYLNSDGQLGQLKSLPGVLRDKILQTLIQRRNIDDNGKTEEINDLMGIFPFLLSSRTRCIELNGIMSFACPRRFKTKRYLDQEETDVTTLKKETECCVQLLQWIEALAPKVETLIIMKNNPFPEISDPSHKKPLVKLEMLQTLKKLPNLKTLRVDLFRFKKNDLLEISFPRSLHKQFLQRETNYCQQLPLAR